LNPKGIDMAISSSTKSHPLAHVFNLPNQLTSLRLLLAVVLFVLIARQCYMASLVVFIVATSTDWLDGYYARKYGMVTTLGRILDPFADKVIICGTFIFLLAVPDPRLRAAGLEAWVVVVIVGRELLITALRSFLEQQGSDFSAAMSGKLKMLAQCIAAGLSLFLLTFPLETGAPGGLALLTTGFIWASVILTVYSGVAYIRTAIRLLHRSDS
jgi:CDP-diacylglycerol--glycerol-3-phosphate 3-phosphatidyltransferase